MSTETAVELTQSSQDARPTMRDRFQDWHRANAEKAARTRALWILVWARFKYWGWTIFAKSPIAVIYLAIVPTGLTHLFPDMGIRLWKVPFFSFLNNYEATHRITLAHLFAIVPLVATWVLWSLLLSMYLARDRFDKTFERFGLDQTRRVILIIGVIVIFADAGLFGASFSMSSWGASSVSATAVVATALYCAVFAFVSLIALFLGDEVTILKEKEKESSSVQDPH